jgi:hypothetical protein
MTNRTVSGVVGMDFLRRYIVQIDAENSLLRVFSPATPSSHEWGHPSAITYSDQELPYVEATVNGTEPIPMLLDLGKTTSASLSFLDITPRFIGHESHWQVAGWTWITYAGQREGVEEKQIVVRAESLAIGGHQHRNMVVSSGMTSILGLSYLLRYVATFDFPRSKLHLKPAARYPLYDRSNLDGMSIVPHESGNILVTFSYIKSPVRDAGIQANDIITHIDGQAVKERSFSWANKHLIWTTDRDVTIDIKRGDEKLRVVLPAGPPSADPPDKAFAEGTHFERLPPP